MNFNLIQVRQLNAADISGYILEVVSPYTGISSSIPSGAQNQVLVKSGVYSAGSNLFYVNGKFGFGTAIPTVDFHLVDKNLTVEGTGVFDTLFVGSSRVITNDELNASGQFLQTAINTLSGFLTSNYYQTGQVDSLYYPRSNPSGFVTSGQTGTYVTTGQTGKFITTGQTGVFTTSGWVNEYYYPRSNPSGYGAGGGGSQTLSFSTGTHILSISSGNSISLGQYLTTGGADSRYVQTGSTGLFISTGLTGAFYPRTNPSGYITGLTTGNFITTGQTGDYYPRSNPSGYAQSSDTGNFVTAGQTGIFITVGQTGSFITTGQTGSYYPRSNPSGYVQSSATGNFVTASQTGNFVTTGQTGLFTTIGQIDELYYPRSNPSGYGAGGGGGAVLSFDSGTQILSVVSGNSVSLNVFLTTGEADLRYAQKSETGFFITSSQTGIFVANTQTGNFVTTGQTGDFYSRGNPSGYITGLNTGNFITTSQTGVFYPRTNPSGYVLSSETGIFVSNSNTGSFATTGWVNQYYYPRSNPSGYGAGGGGSQTLSFDNATEILSISSGNSVSLGQYMTTGEADERYAQVSQTGSFITTDMTGQFQPFGSYVTTAETGNFVDTSMTGQFQPFGSYVTTDETGQFYPYSNPSGFITGVNTGNFVTTSQTGEFKPLWLLNSSIISPVSGYRVSGSTGYFQSVFILPTGIPTGTGSYGLSGSFVFDDSYLYVCIANNSWRRTSLSTW